MCLSALLKQYQILPLSVIITPDQPSKSHFKGVLYAYIHPRQSIANRNQRQIHPLESCTLQPESLCRQVLSRPSGRLCARDCGIYHQPACGDHSRRNLSAKTTVCGFFVLYLELDGCARAPARAAKGSARHCTLAWRAGGFLSC